MSNDNYWDSLRYLEAWNNTDIFSSALFLTGELAEEILLEFDSDVPSEWKTFCEATNYRILGSGMRVYDYRGLTEDARNYTSLCVADDIRHRKIEWFKYRGIFLCPEVSPRLMAQNAEGFTICSSWIDPHKGALPHDILDNMPIVNIIG